MNRILKKSAYLNAILSIYKTLINFLQLVVISRMLGPEPFSYMAVMLAIFNILNTMTEFGVGTSILSKKEVNSGYIKAALKISISLSIFVAAIALILKVYIVNYFSKYNLDYSYEILIALLFPVAVSQVYRSLGEKKMKFDIILKIESFSLTLGFILAYLMANTEYILYALPIGYSVNVLSNSFLYWLNFKCDISGDINKSQVSDITKFGFTTMVANILNTINNQIDSLLIGSQLPKVDFGNYSLAKDTNFKIHSAINPILGRVYLPHMVNNAESLLSDYKTYINILIVVNTLFYMPLVFYSSEIVNFIWGQEWASASELFGLFAIWGLIRSCMNPIGTIIYATRQPKLAILSSLMQLAVTVPLMLFMVRYNVYWVAIGQIIIMLLSYYITWKLIVFKIINIKFYTYISIAIKPILISFFIFISLYYLLYNNNFIINIIISSILYFILIMKTNPLVFKLFSLK